MSTASHGPNPFDRTPLTFTARDDCAYRMCGLDVGRAGRYASTLLALQRLIPRTIQWSEHELLCLELNGRVFLHKWLLSALVAPIDVDEPIGFIIAYLRLAESQHPLDAVYIHRMAIAPPYQRRGIGTAFLRAYLAGVFEYLPWLLNLSVQTNDATDNLGVVYFYERAGFRKVQHVEYPDKRDWLLVASRDRADVPEPLVPAPLSLESAHRPPAHPRAPRLWSVPRILMSSSSTEKLSQFRYLFAQYNVALSELACPVELTEPQIVDASADSELALVRHPLKLVARFLAAGKRTPFLVEDTMLFIEFFNSHYEADAELPGHDVKRWWRQLGTDGVLRLMGSTTLRRAHYVSQLGVYLGRDRYVYARGETHGRIAQHSRVADEALRGVPATSPWFFHSIFVPDGSTRTLAEMDAGEFASFDYRRRAVVELLGKDVFSGNGQLVFRYALE